MKDILTTVEECDAIQQTLIDEIGSQNHKADLDGSPREVDPFTIHVGT